MAIKKRSDSWRATRREAARAAIVDAAWAEVRDEGLSSLSIRGLAGRAGISTPTVYAYFGSKNDIIDVMFGQAAAEFEAHLAAPYATDDPRDVLLEGVQRFLSFCASDPPRYQLLFQRLIPDFTPSAESYAPAVRAFDALRARLAANGVTEPHHLDLWTAMTTGLASQQFANDPGGDRWARLAPEAVDMFLDRYGKTPPFAEDTFVRAGV